jgi:hypothetical protein
VASSYPLVGGAKGDGVILQGEHSQTFRLLTSLLVPNHSKTYVTILIQSSTRLVCLDGGLQFFLVLSLFSFTKSCLCGSYGYT